MSERSDIEAIVDRLFVGEAVTPESVASAATALSGDAEARAYYDDVARLDAILGGDFEDRFGEALFLGRLDAMLAEEADAARIATADATPANTNRPVGALLAMVALVMFGLVPLLHSRLVEPDEFQARSAVVSNDTTYRTPEFDVYCVTRDGGTVSFAGPSDFEFGTVRCARNQEIKVAARTLDPRLRYAAFFGIASDAKLYWYGPSPARTEPHAVTTASRLVPLGETIRLGTNHEPGPVRVVGVFTERALDFEALEALVRQNVKNLRDGRIRIPDGVAVRKTFEVTP